jgi:hypothetical protein
VRGVAFAVASAIALGVSATAVHADDPGPDPLAEAIRLEASLDYDAALVIVEREIAGGGNDRDRLVTLHMFAGKLAAGLDRVDKADYHFARVVALSPTTTFAEGTSPKITEPFDAARARTAPLRVTTSIEGNAVVIAASPDPNRIVAGIIVELADGGHAKKRDALRVELPANATPTRVIALDAYGNHVWTEQLGTIARRDDVREPELRPLYARWPFWATGTVVALAAGGVCAWRMDKAQSEFDRLKLTGVELAVLQDVEARGDRWALAANISFGVAAASTVIAIITAARGSHTTTIVTARADADSVGLAIAGQF